jgi:16S rRNA (uracil1498-N3)-methyltransferase
MPEPWFHVTALPAPGQIAQLDARESQHARGARRLELGESVVLFDGYGATAPAILCEVERRCVGARAEAVEYHDRPSPALHVVSALPRGDRLAQLLSMATQLGMSSFRPLQCQRGVARPRAGARERWERILREACKQSRRAWLPEIGEPCAPQVIATLSANATLSAKRSAVVLLDPSGARSASVVAEPKLRDAEAIWLVIGPEGGLDEDERAQMFSDGALALTLSEGILRIETAVAAGLTLLSQLRL